MLGSLARLASHREVFLRSSAAASWTGIRPLQAISIQRDNFKASRRYGLLGLPGGTVLNMPVAGVAQCANAR